MIIIACMSPSPRTKYSVYTPRRRTDADSDEGWPYTRPTGREISPILLRRISGNKRLSDQGQHRVMPQPEIEFVKYVWASRALQESDATL
jgi:hypothetical protein